MPIFKDVVSSKYINESENLVLMKGWLLQRLSIKNKKHQRTCIFKEKQMISTTIHCMSQCVKLHWHLLANNKSCHHLTFFNIKEQQITHISRSDVLVAPDMIHMLVFFSIERKPYYSTSTYFNVPARLFWLTSSAPLLR